MKKFVLWLSALTLLAVFVGTAVFLYQKSEEPPEVFKTASPETKTIVKKTIATGTIIPRREVEIKSQVSGVVDKVFVEAGSEIKQGDLITRIRIIPNVERLNAAEAQLETARIEFDNASRELKRQQQLYNDKIISEFEFNKFSHQHNLRRTAVESAERNLDIIREGASDKVGQTSNLVEATLDGTVLDVTVKEGTFIRESNNFNAGTTIANVANMKDMIFEGAVDESEVGKLREGMELRLNIGAIEAQPFTANLEYIAPKGYNDQGTVKFQIRAAVNLQAGRFIRAGYSANADIVLDQRNDVLAVNESLLQFDGEQVFVEVETAPNVFERRDIEVGLSDGIFIEVINGISAADSIKKPR